MNKQGFLNNDPYIIAEMNSSHFGNVDTAFRMIDSAKECGCDCVKFQSWTPESLYCDQYYDENPISRRVISKVSFGPDELKEIRDYCISKEIDFSSTPYSEGEVDYLAGELNARFIKIASMEINNVSFLKYIAKKHMPIILSTGMATIDEIEKALRAIKETGNSDICLLHCVSVYPVSIEDASLGNIELLKETFPDLLIGYSDHTLGWEAAIAAVALGAKVIEKHFTLDNGKVGMDNNMATEPEDFKRMIQTCRATRKSVCRKTRVLSDGEMEMRKQMRRSLVASRDIEEGEMLSEENLTALRPGNGMDLACFDNLVGKKALRRIIKGYKISLDDLE